MIPIQFSKEAFKYLGWILLFILLFFRGCSGPEKSTVTEKIIIPEIKGSFEAKKPIHVQYVAQKKGKGNAVFVENPIYAKLLAENINLQVNFAKANDSIKKLQFAKAIELNKFSTKFENEKLILNIDGIVQGEVKEITPSYIWKKQAVEVRIKNKETVFRLLGGLEIGNNIQLSNPIFKANLGMQNRKGNIITGSYDSNKNIYVGYQFSIFNIRR